MRNFRFNKGDKFKKNFNRNKDTDYKMPAVETSKTSESRDTSLISRKMKDIKFETFTAMGYDKAITAASKPYPLFGKLNRTIDINYGGDLNDLANNAVNYNSDRRSLMVHVNDMARQTIMFNYNYIPSGSGSVNAAKMIDIQTRALEEVLTAARLENYNRLEILDRDELDFSTDYENNASTIHITESKGSRMISFFNSYQANLLNFCLIPAYYNRLVSMIDYLTTMTYQMGDLYLSSVGKLLNKTTVRDVFANYNIAIKRSYVDTNWFKIMENTTLTPSRKADEIVSPMLTINAYNNVVSSRFIQYTDGSRSTELLRLMDINWGGSITIPTGVGSNATRQVTRQQLLNEIMVYLSPYYLVRWARLNHSGLINQTPEAYVNYLTDIVTTYLNDQISMVTLNEYLEDLMTTNERLGILNWVKGQQYTFSKDNVYSPAHNKIIEDIYRSTLSGNHQLDYNAEYMSWEFSTLWDKKRGLVSYDAYRKGLILCNSFRHLNGVTDEVIDNHPVPILINNASNIDIQTRYGVQTTLTTNELTSHEIRDSLILSRLNIMRDGYGPNPNPTYSLHIPTAVLPEADYATTNVSLIQMFMQDVFGYGQTIFTRTTPLTDAEESDAGTVQETRSVFIDPTVFSIITVRTDTYGANAINDIRRRTFIKVPISNEEPQFSFL